MARTATITLDENQYLVHAFNLKELQEVGDIIGTGDSNNVTVGMKILAVALRRSDPPVDLNVVEPTIPEVITATDAILKLAGIETKNPQLAAPATS